MKYRSIENMVSFMVNIASDDSHQYSQAVRFGPSFDCSSLVSFALIYGGFNVRYSSTTWDLLSQLKSNGWEIITSSERKRGDIFLNPDHHVIVCVDDKNIVHASGTKKGILVEPFYIPSFGYQYHLRYSQSESQTNCAIPPNKSIHEIASEVIAGKWSNYPKRKELLENAGYNYSEVQREVNRILGGR